MGQIINQFPGGGEDVTAEVEVQTPLIDQIMTALIGKVGLSPNSSNGEITFSEETKTFTVNHNLGAAPDKFVLIQVDENGDFGRFEFISNQIRTLLVNGANNYAYCGVTSSLDQLDYVGLGSSYYTYTATSDTVTFTCGADTPYFLNGSYIWTAIK